MKQLIKNIACGLLLLIFLPACEDNREEGIPEDGICFLKIGWQNAEVLNLGKDCVVDFTVSKGGTGKSDASFSVVVSQEVLDSYNALYGTNYKLLPSDCYQLPVSSGTISAEAYYSSLQVKFNPQKIINLEGVGVVEYVLPLQLQSKNGIMVNDSRDWIIFAPEAEEGKIGFGETGATIIQEVVPGGKAIDTLKSEVVLNYTIDTPVTFTIVRDPAVDQNYINNFNTVNHTSYKLVPEGAYTLVPTEWSIPAGQSEKTFTVRIDKTKLLAYGYYVLPLKINGVSKYTIDSEANTQLLTFSYNIVKFDRSKWTVLFCNSDFSMTPGNEGWSSGNSDRTAKAILDGNTANRWQSKTGDAPPYEFIFDMAEARDVCQVRLYFPIGADSWRGGPKKGYFEISNSYTGSSTTWTRLVDWVRPSDADRENFYDTPATSGRYLRLVITEGFANAMNIMELEAWGNQ